jgi:uncharacterized protein YecA (UPF0149 family)
MSPNQPLTPAQQHALALLSAGSTAAAAAQAVGVHRNTVGNWLQSPTFRDALAHLHGERTQAWRAQSEALASHALDAIRAILADPNAPAAVRLKAALAIRGQVAAPQPQEAPKPTSPAVGNVGRNHPCPCGSGKKFKHCCLRSR